MTDDPYIDPALLDMTREELESHLADLLAEQERIQDHIEFINITTGSTQR